MVVRLICWLIIVIEATGAGFGAVKVMVVALSMVGCVRRAIGRGYWDIVAIKHSENV